MAKIFRTETLNLNGNIRLDSSTSDAFEIKNVAGSTLMSRSSIESDISSLQAKDTLNESDLSVDVSSLAAISTSGTSDLDVDISSLQAEDVKNESDLSVDVSSLQAVDVANESDLSVDISSLHAQDQGNDVRINNVALSTSDSASKDVTFAEAFPSGVTPAVVGLMKAGANDPIIAVQLSAVSNTGATFQFSDDIPADNTYTLVVMASA